MPERAVLLEGRVARRHDVVLEHAGIELRSAVLHGLDAARHRGQHLVLHVYELYGRVGYLARVLARDVHAAHIAVILLRIVLVAEVLHLLPSHFSSSSTPRPVSESMASMTWYWLMQRQ